MAIDYKTLPIGTLLAVVDLASYTAEEGITRFKFFFLLTQANSDSEGAIFTVFDLKHCQLRELNMYSWIARAAFIANEDSLERTEDILRAANGKFHKAPESI
jgi:hypothetical protein